MALDPEKKQELTNEMEKQKYFETTELARANINKKSLYRNLNRSMNRQRQEYEEETSGANVQAAFRENELQRENNLARELDKIKREEIRNVRLRQQIRENSQELREVERKLRAAYINKALTAQIAQKEAERQNEKIQEQKAYEILRHARIEEAELKKKLKQEDINKKANYLKELQDQMILKEKSKRYLYEEFLREKKMLDDIIQRMHDEDEREIVEKMCRMRKTREEMESFKRAQEVWKKRKEAEIIEENRKIQEFLMSKAADIKEKQEAKERKEAIKAKISENIARQIYAEQAKVREKEDIVLELLQEEQKEAIEQKHKKDVEKQIRQRIETLHSLKTQMVEKAERKRQEAEEDAKYKEQMLAKLAEDNRVELLSDQKKRMKLLQLRRDVEQMIIDRRQQYAEERQLLMKLKEEEEYEMEQRKRIIEEERMRMLKEHIENLVGYIPKGLLRPDDLPQLGSDIFERCRPCQSFCME